MSFSPVFNTSSLQPIADSVFANVSTILPVGIVIFAILLGVTLIPALIRYFAKI